MNFLASLHLQLQLQKISGEIIFACASVSHDYMNSLHNIFVDHGMQQNA